MYSKGIAHFGPENLIGVNFRKDLLSRIHKCVFPEDLILRIFLIRDKNPRENFAKQRRFTFAKKNNQS